MSLFKNELYENIIQNYQSFKKQKIFSKGYSRHKLLSESGFKQAPCHFNCGKPTEKAKEYLISLNKTFDSSYHLIIVPALNMDRVTSYLVYIKKI